MRGMTLADLVAQYGYWAVLVGSLLEGESILLLASPFTQGLTGVGTASLPLGDFGSFYASGQAAGQVG